MAEVVPFHKTSRGLPEKKSLVQRGRGGDDSGMMERIERLEKHVDEVRDILRRLEPAIGVLSKEVAEIRGRISQIPSAWQMYMALLTGMVTITGIMIGIFNFA